MMVELEKMLKLENWNEITNGLYRYVIAANCCYEIHMLHWDHSTDMLSANANLYIVGDFLYINGKNSFERELLFAGPLAACLEKAVEDYELCDSDEDEDDYCDEEDENDDDHDDYCED